MNDRFKQMQLQTLDKHLAQVNFPEAPTEGWVCAIRKSLGMSVRQLAERIGITQQSAARLEKNEADDSITLKSLRKAAEALDCRLVYAIVPNEGGLDGIVKKQAFKKACEIVQTVDHSMKLEGQSVGNVRQKTKQVAKELLQNFSSKLWD